VKLKLIKLRTTFTKSLVLLDQKGVSHYWKAVGETIEVPDDFGHSVLSSYGDMLVLDDGTLAKNIVAPETKVIDTATKSTKKKD